MKNKSFKAQLLTFVLGGYLLLWMVMLGVSGFLFKENLLRALESQEKWLTLYTSTFIADLRMGNFLAIKNKLHPLMEDGPFRSAEVVAGSNHISETREGLDQGSFLSFFLPKETLSLPIRDDYRTEWGTFTAQLDRKYFLAPFEQLLFFYGRASLSVFLILLGALFLLLKRYTEPLEKLTHQILDATDQNEAPERVEEILSVPLPLENKELTQLRETFRSAYKNMRVLEGRLGEQKVAAELTKVAVQVAHDIRSPLGIITMLGHTSNKGHEEEHKNLLDGAVAQMRGIADDLLLRYRNSRGESSSEMEATPQLLLYQLHSVFPSLLAQCQKKPKVTLQLLTPPPDLDSCFVVLNRVALGRVLSNLVQNSLEALPESGTITIQVKRQGRSALLELRDTGEGIPEHLIPRLLKEGGSYGKEKGTGLGLLHAVETLKRWGGDLKIESNVGKGTCISMVFPLVEPPEGFASKLFLKPDAPVVILDDDPTMRRTWLKRLGTPQSQNLVGFQGSEEFFAWLDSHPEESKEAIFLIDYELGSGLRNGLEIIEARSLARRSVLVTNRSEDPAVQSKARSLGVLLLPKAHVPWIRVEV